MADCVGEFKDTSRIPADLYNHSDQTALILAQQHVTIRMATTMALRSVMIATTTTVIMLLLLMTMAIAIATTKLSP